MMYIEVDGDKIGALFCGPSIPDGDAFHEVPAGFCGFPGMPLAAFNADWSLRTLEERFALGLIANSDRLKIKDGELVPKTLDDLIRDGTEPVPEGMRINHDAEEGVSCLVSMTLQERVSAGITTRETAETILATEARADRAALFSVSDAAHAAIERKLRRPGADETALLAEMANWDAYAEALADVPEQIDFPWAIIWPKRPDGIQS